MLIVITHHAPVIASMQFMVDVGKVVTSHVTLRINPNLTSKLTIPTLFCDVVRIVDNFFRSAMTYIIMADSRGCLTDCAVRCNRCRSWHQSLGCRQCGEYFGDRFTASDPKQSSMKDCFGSKADLQSKTLERPRSSCARSMSQLRVLQLLDAT
jgi:hypothetical protein